MANRDDLRKLYKINKRLEEAQSLLNDLRPVLLDSSPDQRRQAMWRESDRWISNARASVRVFGRVNYQKEPEELEAYK